MSSVCRRLVSSSPVRRGADCAPARGAPVAAAGLRRSRTTCRSRTHAARDSRTRSRRSSRAIWGGRWPTSGCRSVAASSATRSMPGAATSSSACPRSTGSLQPTRPTTDRPTRSSPAAIVTCGSTRSTIRVLKPLTIGIQITGDDYNNPPAAQALAARHIVQNVRGFTVYGDYSRPDPQREIVDAVADGRVDVAVVWGPLAGYYAKQRADADRRHADRRRRERAVVTVRVRHRDGCAARRSDAASRARRRHRAARCRDAPDPACVRSAAPMMAKAGAAIALAARPCRAAAARRRMGDRRPRRRRSSRLSGRFRVRRRR